MCALQYNSRFVIFSKLYGTRWRKMVSCNAANAVVKLLRGAGLQCIALPDCHSVGNLKRAGSLLHIRHRNFCTKTTIGFRQQMDHTVPPKEFKWTPGNIINEKFKLGTDGHICMVLNREISVPPHVVKLLWTNAILRCAVDGGTNHWRDFLVAHGKQKNPKSGKGDAEATTVIEALDLITGDFDSITTETIEFFKTIPKVHTPDQDATDFTKAINVIQPIMTQRKIKDVVVFHDCSGRLDQIMANINTLFKVQKDNCNVYLLSGDSLTWLLRPGKHTIQVPLDLVKNQRWCSLMPVGGTAHNVTTTGLKWNLYQAHMEFGAMVSTSNTYATEFVQVETDTNLIWSMGAFEFDEKERQAAK